MKVDEIVVLDWMNKEFLFDLEMFELKDEMVEIVK